jgi:predicted metal-dependent peptidase
VLGIDSSGSVTGADLAHFAAQIERIGRRMVAETHVLIFDEEVRAHHRMRGGGWARTLGEWSFARDGGTSFVGMLESAAALAPSAVVVLTDLDGPVGPPPGRAPVIWACPAPPAARPPFGKVLVLDR